MTRGVCVYCVCGVCVCLCVCVCFVVVARVVYSILFVSARNGLIAEHLTRQQAAVIDPISLLQWKAAN